MSIQQGTRPGLFSRLVLASTDHFRAYSNVRLIGLKYMHVAPTFNRCLHIRMPGRDI